MAYNFDITVSASLEDSGLLSRILDFKEDLHHECYRNEDISVSDPAAVDSALLPITFSVRSKCELARFTKLIRKALAQHRVEHVVHVIRR